MTESYPRHRLKNNTKRVVFDALFQKQQGKCFICGVSQAELEAKSKEKAARNPRNAHLVLASVHWKLHIDHCHKTGMIRGLLCERCNHRLGDLENYGFREKPPDLTEEDFTRRCEDTGRWLEEHWEIIFAYMQQDRWLPRQEILSYLQPTP